MPAVALILSAAQAILTQGVPFIVAIKSLNDVRKRMEDEGREDVTDAEMDLFRDRIEARGQRIQDA